jgi:hypothetical protein
MEFFLLHECVLDVGLLYANVTPVLPHNENSGTSQGYKSLEFNRVYRKY